MRIVVNTRFLLPDKMEGIGLFTQEVLKRLVARRPADKFLFLFDRPNDQRFLFGPNVEARVLFPPARHSYLWYWWFEWSIPRVMLSWKADVFLSPDGYLSLRSKVPTILVTHDLAFEHYPDQIPNWASKYYQKNVPKFHEKAAEIIAVSEFTRQDIIKTYGISRDRIFTACNGVRNPFKPLSGNEILSVKTQFSMGESYFFYVGAIHPRKNVERLILAFSLFKERTGSKTKLLLAGRLAWQSGTVKEALEQSLFQEDIIMLGYLSGENLSRVLGAAQALVYVSLFEGFGVPLLEAMWAEVPIISSTVSSMPEVCGDAALLVDPNSTEEIGEAMIKINQDADLRNSLIEKGKYQRTLFSWDRATDVVEQSILRVAQKKH